VLRGRNLVSLGLKGEDQLTHESSAHIPWADTMLGLVCMDMASSFTGGWRVRQAGVGAFSPNATPESGRWEIVMNAASASSRSAQNVS
jgi:hypothetical protein